MSKWILLPWDLIILKKENVERAEVFHDSKGFGIRLKTFMDYLEENQEWRFRSKKTAEKMLLEFHKRLLDE